MLKIHIYRMTHDYGLAPNPFHGYCTLAVCMQKIRNCSSLEIGDWIVGLGSKTIDKKSKKYNRYVQYSDKLIYAMEVNEILDFNQYFLDTRFELKKPQVQSGNLRLMYGDNIYYKDINNEYHQLDSAHSHYDGSENLKHKKKDLLGNNVLISKNFFYFGENAIAIPNEFPFISAEKQQIKKVFASERDLFINWLLENYTNQINGFPINWRNFQQLNLNF